MASTSFHKLSCIGAIFRFYSQTTDRRELGR